MRDWKLLFGICFLALTGCATLTDSVDSLDQSLDQVIKTSYETILAEVQASEKAIESGDLRTARLSNKQAQKDLAAGFAKIQKWEDKLAVKGKEAAKQGDKYNKEHGFTLNPFAQISLGLGVALDGVIHLVLLVALILIGLSILSVFFPVLSPILSLFWTFLRHVVTSAENVVGLAASGVAKLTGKN